MSLDDMAEYAPAEGDTDVQSGAGVDEGQSADAGAEINEGQSDETVTQTGGEPNGVEGLPEGMTPEQAYKQYRNLQVEYSKRTDADKARIEADAVRSEKFAPYGGEDALLNAAKFITSDPEFVELLNKRNNSQYLPDDADEESIEAVNKVRNISMEEIRKMENRLMKEHINPLLEKNQKEYMDNLFKEMDNDPLFGDIWRDYQEDMAKSGIVPNGDNLDINGLKTVFLGTLQKNGDLEKVIAKAHNNRLAASKSNSIEPPKGTSNYAPTDSTSWEEAFANALKK